MSIYFALFRRQQALGIVRQRLLGIHRQLRRIELEAHRQQPQPRFRSIRDTGRRQRRLRERVIVRGNLFGILSRGTQTTHAGETISAIV